MELVEYTEYLVKSICKEPDLVKVNRYDTEEAIVLDILVPESSMGSVMGKGGRNIKAIRVLVQAYAYIKKLKKLEIHVESF